MVMQVWDWKLEGDYHGRDQSKYMFLWSLCDKTLMSFKND